jgi:tyrosine-protein phosphatase SIW14
MKLKRVLHSTKRLLVALIVAFSFASAQEVTMPNIRNFGKVNDGYYRGAQPLQSQVEKLKAMGVKTIIDLRRDFNPRERQWAKEQGLKYFNLPLKSHQRATTAQTDYFLRLVNDPLNVPVFVHCRGGQHRTGAMTAVYRITHDGWSAEQAFVEMKEYGFDDTSQGGPQSQKNFVFEFYDKWKTRP